MIINNDTLPTEDIIPITFMGGTGGNFLCHFIVSAKRNIKTVLELSEHGNAHQNCLKDTFAPPFGHDIPDNKKINFILTSPAQIVTEKPYYTSAHLVDINLINANFKRSVRITYELDDIDEISVLYYGKFFVDTRDTMNVINMKSSYIKYAKMGTILQQPKFTTIENMSNVLFVSWKELFNGNIEELINKISIFTEIDTNNFSRESLMHWRNKTQYCIDKFTDI